MWEFGSRYSLLLVSVLLFDKFLHNNRDWHLTERRGSLEEFSVSNTVEFVVLLHHHDGLTPVK